MTIDTSLQILAASIILTVSGLALWCGILVCIELYKRFNKGDRY